MEYIWKKHPDERPHCRTGLVFSFLYYLGNYPSPSFLLLPHVGWAAWVTRFTQLLWKRQGLMSFASGANVYVDSWLGVDWQRISRGELWARGMAADDFFFFSRRVCWKRREARGS